MLQRDYLLRQIEQMGLFLRMLMAKLLGPGFKGSESVDSILNTSDFRELTQLEPEDLIENNFDILITKIKAIPGFNFDNIELMADFMVQLSGFYPVQKGSNAKILRKNAYLLYDYVNIHGRTFSEERKIKMDQLLSLN